MQIAFSAAALLALACSVLAADPTEGFDPISAPAKDQELVAGETATITWQAAPTKYDEETISIYLMAGKSPSTLQVESEPIACKYPLTRANFLVGPHLVSSRSNRHG
jgi:hypothetical protein